MEKDREKRNRMTRRNMSATCPIQWLEEIRAKGKPIKAVLYMRESTWRQQQGGNLKNRLDELRRRIRNYGIQVLDEFTEVISGRNLDDRSGLVDAIEATREFQKCFPDDTTVLVTDTRNRFIRGLQYNGQASTDEILPIQWADLAKMAQGVMLATVIPPDASFKRVKQYEIEPARQAGKPFGRPKGSCKRKRCKPGAMLRRRERLLPQVHRLHDRGESQRSIAKKLKVSNSTISDWLKSG